MSAKTELVAAVRAGRLALAEVAGITGSELDALYETAVMRLELGRPDEASRMLGALVVLYPFAAEYWRAYAEVLTATGNLPAATKASAMADILAPQPTPPEPTSPTITGLIRPEPTQPTQTQTVGSRPEPTQPTQTQTRTAGHRPEPTQPTQTQTQPAGNRPEPTQPTQPQTVGNRPEPTQPTQTQTVGNRPEPTQPTQPMAPRPPTAPTRPTASTEPSRTSGPTAPRRPTEPTRPTEPIRTTASTDPTEQTEPTEPGRTTEPTEPTEPGRKAEPTQPTRGPGRAAASAPVRRGATWPGRAVDHVEMPRKERTVTAVVDSYRLQSAEEDARLERRMRLRAEAGFDPLDENLTAIIRRRVGLPLGDA